MANNKNSGTALGFEQTLWAAADKLPSRAVSIKIRNSCNDFILKFILKVFIIDSGFSINRSQIN